MAFISSLAERRRGAFSLTHQSKEGVGVTQRIGLEEQGDHSWLSAAIIPLGLAAPAAAVGGICRSSQRGKGNRCAE